MNESQLEMLLASRGPGFPPAARELAALPDGHPIKVRVAAEAAAEEAARAARAALKATADDAKGRAGQGSQTQRIADLEARVAALEAMLGG